MTKMEDILVADDVYDGLATDRLRELLESGTTPERARATGALARRAARDDSLRPEVLEVLMGPDLRGMRLMGISIAHIGVACLYGAAPTALKSEVKALVDAWPEPDRSDLLWFLRSQGLTL